jgi:hypothetical protein
MIGASLHEVVSQSEFHTGIKWGVICAVVGLPIGWLSVSRFKRPAPIAGLLVALAFAGAAKHATGLPAHVTEGLVLLALGGLVAELIGLLWQPLALGGIVLALPGASVLTSNTHVGEASWIRTLVVVTVVVGGTLLADFDRRYHARGWTVILYGVSVVGVYLTVPDTERVLVLLGACLPLIVLGWPFALASFGSAGAYPAVGALAWVAAFEGVGRRSAIIGGVACLGLFVVEPIARALKLEKSTMFDKIPTGALAVVPAAMIQVVLVIFASRVAGLRPTVREAGVLAAGDLIIGLVMLLLLDGEVSRIRPGQGRVTR